MNNWKRLGYDIVVMFILIALIIGLRVSYTESKKFKEATITVNNFVNEQLEEIRERQIYNDLQNLDSINIKKLLTGSVLVQGLQGFGSGTIIKKTENSMYILTCAHVINDVYEAQKEGFKVGTTIGYFINKEDNSQAGVILYGAQIIKYDEENDLALLKTFVNDEVLNEIKIAEQEPNIGDIVYSIGNPLGFIRTVSKGILSNKIKDFFISDNTTTFGNSGGGLFNKDTELIGIPAQVMVYQANENGVVPESSLGMSRDLRTIHAFLKDVTYE